MTIGERLRKLRRDKNWTQDELAKQMGMLAGNVARYENGLNTPRKKMLERFAAAFQISVEALESDPPAGLPEVFQQDPELLSLVQDIGTMNETDRKAVKHVLGLLVKQSRIQQVIAS
jgi:transcriptional regulator with XRE-family HTH domain